jgi:hypothetical protein
MLVTVFGILAATLWPSGGGGQYAVVAPPSYSLSRTIALARVAGGEIVDVGGPQNVIIVHSGRKNFVTALYGAGAWLVVDPQRLRGCLGFAQDPMLSGVHA